MRNYIELRYCTLVDSRFPGSDNLFLCGRTDEELTPQIIGTQTGNPFLVVNGGGNCYVELNKDNVFALIGYPDFDRACRDGAYGLNQFNPYLGAGWDQLFPSPVVFKSPRKTWSHGH